ncbi:MAG: NUDIX domain-containing protein [Hominenteromicrobium sp.]
MDTFIRSTSKALILHEGKLLLNRSRDDYRGDYYSLPGGGQHRFETMEEAVVRECLEETGYRITPRRLAAVCEEIFESGEIRTLYPEYAHRVQHIILCTLDTTEPAGAPTEADFGQLESVWVPVGELDGLNVEPSPLCGRFTAVLNGTAPVLLGSVRIPE